MTLHEAIEKLLLQTRRAMTAREIADALNKNKWYAKGDNSEIDPSQINARVNKNQRLFEIDHSVFPLEIKLFGKQLKATKGKTSQHEKLAKQEQVIDIKHAHLKTSFEPISNSETAILILGTMPGDQSLKLGEYYGHNRNRFWKIISTITKKEMASTYADKKKLLLNSNIAVWDVAHKANRKGSLDTAIEDEEPNDLQTFITKHKNLKVIGFNGAKSEALFLKYFKKRSDIKYVSLPSSSPANTGINMDTICKAWKQLLK